MSDDYYETRGLSNSQFMLTVPCDCARLLVWLRRIPAIRRRWPCPHLSLIERIFRGEKRVPSHVTSIEFRVGDDALFGDLDHFEPPGSDL